MSTVNITNNNRPLITNHNHITIAETNTTNMILHKQLHTLDLV